ncbi:hypothetical protein [secondary endosymbiont of Heteropsylla cubana]
MGVELKTIPIDSISRPLEATFRCYGSIDP